MFPLRDTLPRRGFPVVTSLLILANLAAFAFELSLTPDEQVDLLDACGIVPARYTDPLYAARHHLPERDYWPFLTSQFLHANWLHVLSNLWMLWIFGDNVEERAGPFRFLVLYLACGLAAGAVHLASNPSSMLPTIGASGAISGVMGAYFVLFPRARIVALVPVLFWPVFLEVPAVLFLGLWFLLQFYSGTLTMADDAAAGGVAWWAHVGGFLAGVILRALLVRESPRRP
jgi:membrane associated rhomboid family serine protease